MAAPKLEIIMEFGDDERPEKWGRLQYDPATMDLYLNDHRLVTEKRWSDFERTLAVLGLVIGVIATLATVAAALPPFLEHFGLFGWSSGRA